MQYFFIFLASALLTSCTISITLTDTHGYANDVVDETSKTDADANLSATVPVSAI